MWNSVPIPFLPSYEFAAPWAFFLLLILPMFFIFRLRKKPASLSLPSIQFTQNKGRSVLFSFLKYTKYWVLILLILALARPRYVELRNNDNDGKGIDIMFAIDVSLSMLSRDLEPDRLTALKGIAQDFISKRQGDRIGLVAYSGEAVTKVPLTTDHDVLREEIGNLYPNELAQGTAIGEGLAVAVSHLQNKSSKSKIILLMTDGVNTIENQIPPIIAAQLAADSNIKVYTIGIGTNGVALMPTRSNIFGELVFDMVEVKIDEPVLREIAQTTGGKYFRAETNSDLLGVYKEIDSLEKTNYSKSKLYSYKENYKYFLIPALLLLLLDILIRWTLYRQII